MAVRSGIVRSGQVRSGQVRSVRQASKNGTFLIAITKKVIELFVRVHTMVESFFCVLSFGVKYTAVRDVHEVPTSRILVFYIVPPKVEYDSKNCG